MKKTFKDIFGYCPKVVMLPTEKAMLYLTTNNKLEFGIKEHKKDSNFNPQHLYIISDEEIKEGDWCIHNNTVKQAIGDVISFANKHAKKIVATTDINLSEPLPTGWFRGKIYPQLPESFIQAYIKAYNEGKPITEVDLEMVIKEGDYIGLVCNCGTIQPLIGGSDGPCEDCGGYEFEDEYEEIQIIKTRPDNTVIVRETQQYNFEDICSLTTFIRENNYKWEGKGITNTEIIEIWKKNGNQ